MLKTWLNLLKKTVLYYCIFLAWEYLYYPVSASVSQVFRLRRLYEVPDLASSFVWKVRAHDLSN